MKFEREKWKGTEKKWDRRKWRYGFDWNACISKKNEK